MIIFNSDKDNDIIRYIIILYRIISAKNRSSVLGVIMGLFSYLMPIPIPFIVHFSEFDCHFRFGFFIILDQVHAAARPIHANLLDSQ